MADIIDINVLETVEEVTINVVDNVIQVNINKITSTAVTNTSELINDGEDGVHPYITLLDLPSNLILYPTTVASDVIGYVKLVTDIHDPEYNVTAVNVSTGSITTTNQLISSLITVPNLINGNPGVFNISTIGNIRRTAGSGTAEFYFNIYKRDALGVETLIGVSNPTLPVNNGVYAEFNATAIWDDGIFTDTDRVVLKFYANRISGGSNPTYEFQFGGLTPVRTLVPIPLSVVPNNPTLQQVLDNNHDLVNGNNFQGTLAGDAQTGINVNAFGSDAGNLNTGSDVNFLGSGAGYENSGNNINFLGTGAGDANTGSDVIGIGQSSASGNTANHVNVFGSGAGANNTFKNVNLFGFQATADADNQNVFSKWVSGITKYLGRLSFNNITADRKWELPDVSGTIALTSDIPAPITIDATPTDGSANAVSSNGVFDALATKFTLPTLTSGSVLFSNGTTISQDNANFFWDDTNNRLGIGAISPQARLDVRAQGALSTDIAFRVRNSADTDNIIQVQGNNDVSIKGIFNIKATTSNFGNAEFKLISNSGSTSYSFFSADSLLGSSIGGFGIYDNITLSSPFAFRRGAPSNSFYMFQDGAIVMQNGGNLSATINPNQSARLAINSTTQGFLPPRMTTTQKNAIASPVAGLVVYDSTLNKLCVRTASAWETITSI